MVTDVLLADDAPEIRLGGGWQLGDTNTDVALAGVRNQLYMHTLLQIQGAWETVQIVMADYNSKCGGPVNDIGFLQPEM